MDTVAIRLELLKKQGEGFSKCETVKHLVETFHISHSAGYYHFETMGKWVGSYLDFKNVAEFRFNIMNQFNNINRDAQFHLLHTKDDNARIGYMRVRLEALSKLGEFLPKDATFTRTPDEIRLTWQGDLTNPEFQKRIDELIKISREPQGDVNHLAEVVDPDQYTPDEKATLDTAYRIIRDKNPVNREESLH